MAWTNVIKDNVLDSLKTVLVAEFGATMPIHFDREYSRRAPQYINLEPVGDTLLDTSVSSQTREYETELRYYIRMGGEFRKHSHLDRITSTVERIKRELFDNANYAPSGAYKYHDGRVTSFEYNVAKTEEEEQDENLDVTQILFTCTVTEVIG